MHGTLILDQVKHGRGAWDNGECPMERSPAKSQIKHLWGGQFLRENQECTLP